MLTGNVMGACAVPISLLKWLTQTTYVIYCSYEYTTKLFKTETVLAPTKFIKIMLRFLKFQDFYNNLVDFLFYEIVQ